MKQHSIEDAFPSRRPSPDPNLLLLGVLDDVGGCLHTLSQRDRPAGEQRDERVCYVRAEEKRAAGLAAAVERFLRV